MIFIYVSPLTDDAVIPSFFFSLESKCLNQVILFKLHRNLDSAYQSKC